MVARKLAYNPENDALGEGDFWAEYMESEDDCMAGPFFDLAGHEITGDDP